MDVVIQPFAEPQAGHGTDLHAPLLAALEDYGTCGPSCWHLTATGTKGRPPVEAATRLRLKGVPVFAVPVGSPDRLPDVELLQPRRAHVRRRRASRCACRSRSKARCPAITLATVILRTSDGDKSRRKCGSPPMGRTSDWIVWKPERPANTNLTLEVPRHSDEIA